MPPSHPAPPPEPRNLKGPRYILKCSKRGLPRSHPTSGLFCNTVTYVVGGCRVRGVATLSFAPCPRSLRTHSLLFRFLLDKHCMGASSSSSSSSSTQVYLFVFWLPYTFFLCSGVAFASSRSSSICARTLVVPPSLLLSAFSCFSSFQTFTNFGEGQGEGGWVALAGWETRGIVNFYPLPSFFLHSEIRRSFTNDFRGNSAGESLNPTLLDLRPVARLCGKMHVTWWNRRLLSRCSDGWQNAFYCKLLIVLI